MSRSLLSAVINADRQKLDVLLHEEELAERRKDAEYWAPLLKELEMLRHRAGSGKGE
jgi:hypothetical protein